MKVLLTMIPLAVALPAVYVFAAGQTPAAKAPAIRYVSAQRVFAESTDGKADGARVQALQQQKTAELRTRQQTLQATRQQLAQATDGATRTQLLQQEQTQQADLERATLQAQNELQTMQRQVQANVFGRVKSALDELTKGQNIEMVLNADQAVVWSAPGADMTTAVIERLNSKPAAAATPAPSPR